METIDLKKQLKHLYQPSAKEVVEVDVPPMNYLMMDGTGDPNQSAVYAEVVEALFAVSYAVKFMVKKGPLAINYGVMPLEGLWWVEDMTQFTIEEKSNWQWTMLMMQPDFVPPDVIAAAMADVQQKKGLTAVSHMRLESFHEGHCAQILHIGPFTAEGPTIARVHQFIDARSQRRGKHHEIYLSDIRQADPAKWKTVIRQPMQ